MKKKGTYVALAVIMAVLLLGIGYAAIADKTLVITGDAATAFDDTQFSVVFTEGKKGDGTFDTYEASASDAKGTFKVAGMKKTGDTATFIYTVKNTSTELSAALQAPDIQLTGNPEFFDVKAVYTTGGVLAKGATDTLTVTVKLIKTPATTDAKLNATINLVAKPTEV